MSKGFNIGDIGDILQKAQQMQERFSEVQEQVGNRTVEASAGGGMVTAVVNGRLQIVSLRIDPQVVNGGDLDMLQDLIIAAVNQAIRNAQSMVTEEMQKVTGGLKIPGLTP